MEPGQSKKRLMGKVGRQWVYSGGGGADVFPKINSTVLKAKESFCCCSQYSRQLFL